MKSIFSKLFKLDLFAQRIGAGLILSQCFFWLVSIGFGQSLLSNTETSSKDSSSKDSSSKDSSSKDSSSVETSNADTSSKESPVENNTNKDTAKDVIDARPTAVVGTQMPTHTPLFKKQHQAFRSYINQRSFYYTQASACIDAAGETADLLKCSRDLRLRLKSSDESLKSNRNQILKNFFPEQSLNSK